MIQTKKLTAGLVLASGGHNMLYERWRQIAIERGDQLALRDAPTGRRWTFSQLHAAQSALALDRQPVVFPQGNSATFITTLLAAWRCGKLTIPIEAGQHQPKISLPPPNCLHLKSTSATTGAARMAAFTAQQLAADAEHIVTTMGLTPSQPNLGVISLAHSYGFSNLVLPLLLHGIPLILAASPLPESLRQACLGETALTLPAVPAMWNAWLRADAILPCIRLAISAGAPLPCELERTIFAKHGLKIHNFYGSTECGGIAYDTSDTPRSDDSMVGTPMRNVDLSLNSEGCLRVHSRAVGQTYWPEPAETLTGETFQTSDLVELRDGCVFMRGRTGDIINVAGRKLSPTTIEDVLNQHPAVSACLVFGVPDKVETRADCPVACVVTSKPTTAEDLRQFLLSRLPAWQIPRDWWFVPSLNPNHIGKISRAAWRKQYQER